MFDKRILIFIAVIVCLITGYVLLKPNPLAITAPETETQEVYLYLLNEKKSVAGFEDNDNHEGMVLDYVTREVSGTLDERIFSTFYLLFGGSLTDEEIAMGFTKRPYDEQGVMLKTTLIVDGILEIQLKNDDVLSNVLGVDGAILVESVFRTAQNFDEVDRVIFASHFDIDT